MVALNQGNFTPFPPFPPHFPRPSDMRLLDWHDRDDCRRANVELRVWSHGPLTIQLGEGD